MGDSQKREPGGRRRKRPGPQRFILENTRLQPVPGLPDIRLYMAHEATGLWRLAAKEDDDPPPPYWAFPWAGGMALARYLRDHPEAAAGRRVFDLGAGSGLVAIAAAKAGARSVSAADIDQYAAAAIVLNAAANDVAVTAIEDDVTGGAAPDVDLITVGDLFYEWALAERVTAYLDRALAAGISVLVGDPGRAYLPRARLRALAEYRVPDVGDVEKDKPNASGVYALEL